MTPSTRVLITVACAVLIMARSVDLPARQKGGVSALVGGTLIDGFGGPVIRNSVIIIEGERIKAVGQVGSLPVPPGAEVISTEGMSVLPGLWDMHVHLMINGHADYEHWDKTYPAQFEPVISARRSRPASTSATASTRERFQARPSTSLDHSSRRSRIRGLNCSAGE